MDVTQADIDEGSQFRLDLWNVFEYVDGIFAGRFQDAGHGFAFVLDLQCFLVVAAAAADIARNGNIGQEPHFNALQAIALAGLAAAALYVEAEAAGLVAALARFRQHGEDVADRRKDSRISGRIRARRAADG